VLKAIFVQAIVVLLKTNTVQRPRMGISPLQLVVYAQQKAICG